MQTWTRDPVRSTRRAASGAALVRKRRLCGRFGSRRGTVPAADATRAVVGAMRERAARSRGSHARVAFKNGPEVRSFFTRGLPIGTEPAPDGRVHW